MLLFPQLLSGAIAQFPLTKSYAVSNVTNLQEDGSRYQSGSTNPTDVSWTLTYSHLTEAEADRLSSFFLETNGRLLPFTFLDPMVNLLSWSEDFSQPIWEKSPLVTATATDAASFTVLQLGGANSIDVSQTLQCPAAALVCFSIYARADQPVSLKLAVADVRQSFVLTTTWKQYFVAGADSSNSETKDVSLSLDGGPAEVSRLTASPQPAPSVYTVTQETSGLRPQTRFDQDSLLVAVLGKDDLACKVRLTTRLT